MEKKTKKDMYEAIIDMVKPQDRDLTENEAMIIDFCQSQIEMIVAKNEKAKEYRAKKAPKEDTLKEEVKNILTNEDQTVDEIYSKVDNDLYTKAMVVSRLTALCKEEIAEKDETKTDTKRRLKVYRLK